MSSLKLLKEKAPLVICITNDVVKNFTANGLVALGASPAMSEFKDDLEDLLKYGASAYRKRVVDDLLENYKISAIRGNAGEIGSLVGMDIASKGVDSANVDNIGELALITNKKYNIPIVVTGEVDAIAVAGEVITIHNGSSMMPKVIGTGCLLGAVVASFIGLDKDNVFKSLETSLLAYNIAGEFAEKRPNGHLPGTYKVEFINSLYEVTDGDISLHKKVKRYV